MRWLMGLALTAWCCGVNAADAVSNARRPRDDAELRFWLENMVWHHRFTADEASLATGLSAEEISRAQERFGITLNSRPLLRSPSGCVRMLPYPGGRHPRIGFLEGAIDPQRETKISVFTPWDEMSYVVVDVPEAIWCQHGLLYLAHTHIPTMWSKNGIILDRLEWNRLPNGRLEIKRKLPDGVVFGAMAEPLTNEVRMELWLRNGGKETLRDLRVQNCVMLKGAAGFNQQTNENKIFRPPLVACGSPGGQRWIITAWTPIHRTWANAPVPCLHSDPKFPDCAPGETQRIHGRLWFYEGAGITNELKRLAVSSTERN
jgi:hypothetical protein